MSDTRAAEEARDLVAHRLHRLLCIGDWSTCNTHGIHWHDAEFILAALAEAGLLVTPSTPDSPRTWTLPLPDPDVSAVSDVGGKVWRRTDDNQWWGGKVHNRIAGPTPVTWTWRELLDRRGPLTDVTDATGEVHSGG